MAYEVTIPRLGWSMEVGTLAEWHKEDGDRVEAGEILFTVEGDKALQEVEALESGILRIPPDSPPPGQELPVGTLLAYILEPGEEAPFEGTAASVPTQAAASSLAGPELATPELAPPAPARVEPTPAPTAGRDKDGLPAISPRARRVAEELGVDWTVLQGSGRTGRIVERDVRGAAEAGVPELPIKISPVARRLAEEAGLDLAELAAARRGARIQRQDVEAAIADREGVPPMAPPTAAEGEALPVTQIRRVIAQRMAESAHTTAAVTLTTEADATELVALREEIKTTLSPRDLAVPTYTDLMVKLTGVALKEHPMLNARWESAEDDAGAAARIVMPNEVHIAVAVDTEAGLLVPVIRDVPTKSLQSIAEETRVLADKARARELGPEELGGGTFTITNLGTYGIDAFTPIINLPQCAILGVGRIIAKPAVWGDQVVPRQMMALSLTFDHRVVDGGPAARFLNTVREYVEQPYLWLTA
jgi:pyruvate dehydrogenase E2 component (dihydrolipoamide acetyltransferase)